MTKSARWALGVSALAVLGFLEMVVAEEIKVQVAYLVL